MSLVLATAVFATPFASRAQQTAPPPAAPRSAAAPSPYAPPAGASDPYAAPPAPYGAPAAHGAPAYGYGPSPVQLMIYENSKKSPGLALVLDILFPGAGSLYAEHAWGALVTWGGMLGGIAVAVVGLEYDANRQNTTSSDDGDALILLGLAGLVAFRVYGMVDAYSSAKDFNVDLARRLCLPEMNLSLAPIRTRESTALAPTLTVRF